MLNLIIPPISDCFMPTLGAAQLAGFLKSNNIACRVHDAGAELLYRLFILNTRQSEDKQYTYRALAECVEKFSRENEGFIIKTDGFESGFPWRETERLLEYIKQENAFTRELEKLSFVQESDSEENRQEYYGFSISFECQVVPALILAAIVKRKKRNAKICIGGALLYNYENDFYKIFYESKLIDVLIVGAGEEALKYVSLGKLSEFGRREDIKIKDIKGRYVIDTREIKVKPTVYEPDYSDINFEYYPSGEKAFPYMIKDRCYYGKCHFCNGDRVGEQETVKDIAAAFKCIESIAMKTGIRNVYLVDAALSPKDLKAIVNLNLSLRINWIANGRLEKSLKNEELIEGLSRKGCVMLRFGLESASQKVLDLMNKGIDISAAEDILNMTARYGIKNHVYLMFGYPGETKEDRKKTLDFSERNKKIISSYSVSVFQPIPGTQIYRDLLKEVGETENAYEYMLDILYGNGRYNEIYEDISRLDDLLKDCTRTNLEYYSANIFNESAMCEEERYFSEKEVLTAEEKVNREISIQFSPKIR